MRLLDLLMDIAFPPRPSELVVRGIDAAAFSSLLSPVVASDSRTTALLPYADTQVQSCIIETKYHGNAKATELLAQVLHAYLTGLSRGPLILVPIPLSPARLKERGYNQAERVARLACVGHESHVRIETDLLIRTRDTLPQTTLNGSKRVENIKGAFALTRRCDPAHTYIVFDDVVTTGTTISEAVHVLKEGGATSIIPLALAH